jgi:AAA+ superfamily predicted ATPase
MWERSGAFSIPSSKFLEQDDTDSLFVAATNHPQLLDRAIFRRFDAVVEYPLPTGNIAKEVIRNRLASVGLAKIAWARVTEAADGLSHSEITLAAERAAKDAILAGKSRTTTANLISALQDRRTGSRP